MRPKSEKNGAKWENSSWLEVIEKMEKMNEVT